MPEFPAHAAARAPALQVEQWFNTDAAPELEAMRGKVVLLHAFQMLCPACLSRGLPQAERVHRLLRNEGLVVIGLHTVFEHHDVMGPEALRVFIHEYRWSFPIGVDCPGSRGGLPATMQAYHFGGTPSLALIDRAGRIRLHHLGHIDDLLLGSQIGQLLAEPLAEDASVQAERGKA